MPPPFPPQAAWIDAHTLRASCPAIEVATATVVGSPGLQFAASGFTITRGSGSFLTEGFAVGQTVTISGTTDNNTSQIGRAHV